MENKVLFEQVSSEYLKILNVVSKIKNSDFFKKEKIELWSIAENVHHLSLSLFPVNNILKEPSLMTNRWGISNRKSRTYEQFLDAYNKSKRGLDWKAFPPFVPKSENENSEYVKIHSAKSQNKINDFYKFTGEQIQELRDRIQLQTQVEKEETIKMFELQYQSFFSVTKDIEENQMDNHQIPLPYIGLITLKEMIYFIHNHTQYHRLTIERLIKKVV